jgi:hypothetical protein
VGYKINAAGEGDDKGNKPKELPFPTRKKFPCRLHMRALRDDHDLLKKTADAMPETGLRKAMSGAKQVERVKNRMAAAVVPTAAGGSSTGGAAPVGPAPAASAVTVGPSAEHQKQLLEQQQKLRAKAAVEKTKRRAKRRRSSWQMRRRLNKRSNKSSLGMYQGPTSVATPQQPIWLKLGQNRRTIVFSTLCVNCSKHMSKIAGCVTVLHSLRHMSLHVQTAP